MNYHLKAKMKAHFLYCSSYTVSVVFKELSWNTFSRFGVLRPTNETRRRPGWVPVTDQFWHFANDFENDYLTVANEMSVERLQS